MRKSDRSDGALVEAINAYRGKRYAEAEALTDCFLSSAPRHAGGQQLKALLALLRGDIERAAAAIAISLEERPRHLQTAGIAVKIAVALVGAARADANRGKPAVAIVQFRQALWLDPANAEGWFGLGLAQQDVKDYPGAAEAFAQVVALRPKDARAMVNHGISLQQSGDLKGAIASYCLAYQADSSTFAAISQALSAASTGLLLLDFQALRDRLSGP